MTDLILHHYDASPFSQKALRMLGIKNVAWRSVQMPMMPPKDDLVALTGGYRGTPVLQVGADIYVDSQLIAEALERLVPQPTLFPGGAGMALALVRWSDAFFRAGLKIVLGLQAAQWPEEFRRDRQQLFQDIDFDTIGRDSAHHRAQFRAHAWLLEQQLADGRRFLGGEAAGLADIQAHVFVWMARGAMTDVAALLLDDFVHLRAWEARMNAVGEGRRTEIDAATAHAVARGGLIGFTASIDRHDAQQLHAGQIVDVAPDDTPRGGSRGELVIAAPNEIAIRRADPRVGTVLVHFPRLGYRVTPVA